MAHIRQSRPDSGLGFRVKVLKIFQVVPSSLGSGERFLACRVMTIEAGNFLWGPELNQIPSISPWGADLLFFFTLVTGPRRFLSLKLSDKRVYEPQIRARRDKQKRHPQFRRGVQIVVADASGREKRCSPKPKSLNTKHETLNTKSKTQNPEHELLSPKP